MKTPVFRGFFILGKKLPLFVSSGRFDFRFNGFSAAQSAKPLNQSGFLQVNIEEAKKSQDLMMYITAFRKQSQIYKSRKSNII